MAADALAAYRGDTVCFVGEGAPGVADAVASPATAGRTFELRRSEAAIDAGKSSSAAELSRAMLRVMATDNMKNRMMTLGADVTPLGPDEFAAYVKADDKRLTPIIKSLDMKSN
jgi:uncharacterized protein YbjT (DUF2867 family)